MFFASTWPSSLCYREIQETLPSECRVGNQVARSTHLRLACTGRGKVLRVCECCWQAVSLSGMQSKQGPQFWAQELSSTETGKMLRVVKLFNLSSKIGQQVAAKAALSLGFHRPVRTGRDGLRAYLVSRSPLWQSNGEGCAPCHSPIPQHTHAHTHKDTFFAKAGTRNQGSLGVGDGSQASFTGQDLMDVQGGAALGEDPPWDAPGISVSGGQWEAQMPISAWESLLSSALEICWATTCHMLQVEAVAENQRGQGFTQTQGVGPGG